MTVLVSYYVGFGLTPCTGCRQHWGCRQAHHRHSARNSCGWNSTTLPHKCQPAALLMPSSCCSNIFLLWIYHIRQSCGLSVAFWRESWVLNPLWGEVCVWLSSASVCYKVPTKYISWPDLGFAGLGFSCHFLCVFQHSQNQQIQNHIRCTLHPTVHLTTKILSRKPYPAGFIGFIVVFCTSIVRWCQVII